ncbi:hypothetical protein TRFO_17346 [Tritrichomonas foetus]|uniref:Uncharacterized protein n=1 Tax=Tritrichomonas foetus TaxID=1144522 RepID=A0A1J4KTA6_9EUKA|nr:hypothetical protein TRFO_17346 [Tritrichomonas foetus]|eukprot:OHT12725.1 hypothetical protein TRFO_17346 [Tritrichomonas foetus]
MLIFFTCLLTTFFNEPFEDSTLGQWTVIHPASNYSVKECHASHPRLKRNCLLLTNPNDKISLKAKLDDQITNLPVLIYFTTRSSLPADRSVSSLKFFSKSKNVFSTGYTFSSYPEYQFNVSDKITSRGLIRHDSQITHSIAVILRSNKNYELYSDGMILANGTIDNSLPITDIQLDIENSNNTIEVGNIIITDDVKQRWPILISTLLRFRQIEHSAIIKELVDEYEDGLFEGIPFKEKLNLADEEGALLDEGEADPRRFMFPFKISNPNDEDDELTALHRQASFDDVEVRKIEEYEDSEDEL